MRRRQNKARDRLGGSRASAFPDGVWFVDLAPRTDAGRLESDGRKRAARKRISRTVTSLVLSAMGEECMSALPTGTITFLFTDIEGSTKLWEEQPDTMRLALARHDALLRAAIETNGGTVFKTMGDAFCAAFTTAPQAIEAALSAQQSLHQVKAGVGSDLMLKVRMALHTGATEQREGDYFGQPLNRVARLLSAGHGGQVLLSDVAHDLCRDSLPPASSLKSLGEHRLRDLARPEIIFQLR